MCQGGTGCQARKFEQVLSWTVAWVSEIFVIGLNTRKKLG